MTSMLTNVASLSAQRSARAHNLLLMDSLLKLSTGSSINRAADNPAGLIASENLSAALVELQAQTEASQRASGQAAAAEGALGKSRGLLIEADRLTLANAGNTLSDAEKQANQLQINSIVSSVDRLSRTTSFNGQQLPDGTATLKAADSSLKLTSVATDQIGQVRLQGKDYTLADVRSGGQLDTTGPNAAGAQQAIHSALSQVNTLRGKVGAFESTMIGSQLGSLGTAVESLSAARSVIRDTDYAAEVSTMLRRQMLQNANNSILKLAERSSLNALVLLGG